MSAVRYADRISCDYPDCHSVADAQLHEGHFEHEPPAGWLCLGGRDITIMTPFGQSVRDLCSLHSAVPVDKLAAMFTLKKEKTDGDGD